MSIPIHDLPSPQQFAQLNRVERLAVLREAQAVHGVNSIEYCRLARAHTHMVRNASGQGEDER